jgi:hypothetical protein
MHLTIGSTSYDLTTRALVIAVGRVTEGADLVELDDGVGPAPLPVYAIAADDAGVGRALSAGAGLVRLTAPSAGALALCAAAGATVVVPAGTGAGAGLPPDRVVPDSLLVDVTRHQHPVAATAVGVIRGARLVRTAEPRGARRVCDVLAAVLEAR